MVRCILKSEKSKELQRKGNLKLSHTGTLTWFFFLLINAELKLFFLLWRKVLTMIASWEILKLNVIKLLKGLHVFFVKQSLSIFLPSASLQCRRFHRARANGFNRESAMLKLPKRGGNGASQGEGGGGGEKEEKTPARKHCENDKHPLISRAWPLFRK